MKYSDRPNAYINAQDLEIAIAKATTYGDALKALREAPSIDIVRCKECRHRSYCYSEVHMTNKKQTTSICKDIDFCGYGERKESE